MVVEGGSRGRGRGRPRKQLVDDIKTGSDSDEEMMEHQVLDPPSDVPM